MSTHQHANYAELRRDFKLARPATIGFNWAVMAIVGLFILLASCTLSHANEPINVNRLANAIYMSEGGAKTRHPYGILAKYKTTTPRQACINTIKTNIRKWNKAGMTGSYKEFIVFMSKTYCPIGAKNDPTGLNRHWVKNTTYYYERG